MRPIPASPPAFSGTLNDLFDSRIVTVLPDAEHVAHIHRSILEHCSKVDPVFLVRAVRGCERGQVYVANSGARFKATDNSPAWWVHHLAFQGIRTVRFEDAPTHMFEAGRLIPRNVNTAGWHVAHILNAKDRNVDWPEWTRQDLVRRFVRNLHPANCFYIPKSDWTRYGGDPRVIAFFVSRYQERYRSIWDEFVSLAGGDTLAAGSREDWDLSYVYPLSQPTYGPTGSSGSSVAASYRFSRLCFKADVIEPLNTGDTFEVITPEGIFRLTKGQFYETFPNVIASRSYRESRIYHFPKVPQIAKQFLVG